MKFLKFLFFFFLEIFDFLNFFGFFLKIWKFVALVKFEHCVPFFCFLTMFCSFPFFAQQSSSSSSAAGLGGADSSTAVPGVADGSAEAPGKTAHQTLETVDVAPMAGVQPETQGEVEEGEPPYKAARSGGVVMVIDGETLCVPEEDVPKVYYEEDRENSS